MANLSQFTEGFVLQAGLILALGAQNIFVLESGLKRNHPLLVALVCLVCDASLIMLGVAGAASVFVAIPMLKITFGALGVSFLVFYGAKKIWEAARPTQSSIPSNRNVSKTTARKAVILTLGFSLLNPHVYLDTIVLIGGFAAKFETLNQRFAFGAGATVFSGLWFFGLAIAAVALSKVLYNDRAMRAISALAGVVLLMLSLSLGKDVLGWINSTSP